MSFSCESLIIFAFNFPEVSGVLKLYGWQGFVVSAQGILLWKIHEDSHLMAIKACTSNLSHYLLLLNRLSQWSPDGSDTCPICKQNIPFFFSNDQTVEEIIFHFTLWPSKYSKRICPLLFQKHFQHHIKANKQHASPKEIFCNFRSSSLE